MMSEIFNIQFLHPSVFYILGGLLIPFLKGRVKQGYMLFVSLLAFFAVVNLPYVHLVPMNSSAGNLHF